MCLTLGGEASKSGTGGLEKKQQEACKEATFDFSRFRSVRSRSKRMGSLGGLMKMIPGMKRSTTACSSRRKPAQTIEATDRSMTEASASNPSSSAPTLQAPAQLPPAVATPRPRCGQACSPIVSENAGDNAADDSGRPAREGDAGMGVGSPVCRQWVVACRAWRTARSARACLERPWARRQSRKPHRPLARPRSAKGFGSL